MGFKKDFYWGGSVSWMQTEGAWQEGGKGPSTYDDIEICLGHTDAWKTAIDTYHRYSEDNRLYEGMGFNCYRFSVDWSRIVPTGEREINEEGLRFYDDFIKDLKAHGMTPMVCLNHFDMPLALYKKYGGWSDRRVLEAFEFFARTVIEHFGNTVSLYVPVNEQNAAIDIACGMLPKELSEKEKALMRARIFHHHFLASDNAIVVDTDGQDIMIFRPLIKYATIMVSTLPMLAVYPFAQRYFVTGVMIGAVKG